MTAFATTQHASKAAHGCTTSCTDTRLHSLSIFRLPYLWGWLHLPKITFTTKHCASGVLPNFVDAT